MITFEVLLFCWHLYYKIVGEIYLVHLLFCMTVPWWGSNIALPEVCPDSRQWLVTSLPPGSDLFASRQWPVYLQAVACDLFASRQWLFASRQWPICLQAVTCLPPGSDLFASRQWPVCLQAVTYLPPGSDLFASKQWLVTCLPPGSGLWAVCLQATV